MLNDKGINNPRISECEDLCIHWKNINLYEKHKSIVLGLKKIFEPFFEIKNIVYGNIGVFISKVNLKAIRIWDIFPLVPPSLPPCLPLGRIHLLQK